MDQENNSFYITISFLSIKLLKELLQPFHLTHSLLRFFLNSLLNSKLFLICLLESLFIKPFYNLCPINYFYYICSRHIVFNFCKNVVLFWYSYMFTNFRFRIFFIILFIKINICAWFYINRLRFNGLWYVILY